MKKSVHIWALFGICLVVSFIAMGWITLTTLELDRAEARAKSEAIREENIRLALWRMDSALTPLVTRESSNPYFFYSSFYPMQRAYTNMYQEMRGGEILMPSPLMTFESLFVLLHFQVNPDGTITSPQVPLGNMRNVAESQFLDRETIPKLEKRLERISSAIDRDAISDALLSAPFYTTALLDVQEKRAGPTVVVAPQQQVYQSQAANQVLRSNAEFDARNINYQNILTNGGVASFGNFDFDGSQLSTETIGSGSVSRIADVSDGIMKPLWIGNDLILARRISVKDDVYFQGCLLNWEALRTELVESIRDLLPEASLEPVRSQSPDEKERLLTILPVKLVPGIVPEIPAPLFSPLRVAVMIAWGCVVLAAGAVAVILFGALSLSERRGAFVSAVTHELRTPLTTLRMYTEMLANGMITDEEKRQQYLKTLQTESDRLGSLVENVLAYSRIENGSRQMVRESLSVKDLLERVKAPLEERIAQGGMTFVLEGLDRLDSTELFIDQSVVERILYNLVDNACKYAANASEKIVRIECEASDETVSIKVSDYGPGISRSEAKRLFKPFHKSARDTDQAIAGIGLGLALSRRLARVIGGDLTIDSSYKKGACFILSLPRA